MLRHLLLLLLLCCSSFFVIAQTASVKGNVRDSVANVPVRNAVVALLSPKDSILKDFTRTKDDGSFELKNLNQGKYILMMMHPSFADFVDNVDLNNEIVSLPPIAATSKSKLLAAIILKSGSPIKIKGDTTIYTADSFNVSANANVEELLKKLPGIQVDKNGEIKAMGEKVERVLVDGEEFFGDDPGMAVKNLRADAVKEVQVFDKKSEQAEFTGIDDGKTQKTINLKLKEDRKTGYFGKVDLSGGLQKNIDDRYNNNVLYSTFKGKRKLSAFFLNGNTGQDGLSWQDSEKYGAESDNVTMSMDDDGGMMYMWRGGGADDEPYVNTENGFIRNINAGVQYSNKWNDKKTFNFAPKYNEQDYTNNTQTLTRQEIGNSSLTTNSNEENNIKRSNIKTRLTYDHKIDSMNSIKFTGNANFYKLENQTLSSSITRNTAGNIINTRDAETRNKSDKYAFSGNLIFKHKFKKARRTFSLTGDWNLLNTDGTNFLNTSNQSFDPFPFNQDVDQMIDVNKTTQRLSLKTVYTEPLSKRYSLELGYEILNNHGNNDQLTFTRTSATTDKYDIPVDSLSNKFKTNIWVNTPSVKINYNHKKIKYNFGSGFGFTNYDLEDKTYNQSYLRNYVNFFPAAGFTYNYKSNHSLRVNYNGSTTQPTINQLQPLRNNYDKFDQYIGNPDLKPSFVNSFNIQQNGYNFIKDIWNYQSVNLTLTGNSITNNIRIDTATGEKVTQPINTNGNLSVNFYTGIGFKVKKLDARFNISPYGNYSKFANYLNDRKTLSKTLNAGLQLYGSKSKDKKYDINVSNNFAYNLNRTSENNNRNKFITNTATADVTIYIKKVWSINTEYQYYYRQKAVEFDQDINNSLWNARVQRTFKNNEFTVYAKVRDILNENIGVDRNYYGNTFTEIRNDRLKRYFMIGFTWDFKNKGAAPNK